MLCAGDATTLTASATGGYGDYSYLWNTQETMTEISVMPAVTTNYVVTVTDRNGCQDTDNVEVMVKPLPTANIPDTSAQCTETPFVLNLNGNPDWTYQWSPPEYFDDPNSPSPTATVPGSATISVVINDGMCTGMDEVFISATEIPDVDVADVDTSCFGAPIVLNPGGASNFTYLWSPSQFLNDATLPSPIAEVVQTTTFTVTITNQTPDLCFKVDTISVFIPPDVALGAPADTAYCDGPPITLSATGINVEYVWYLNGVQIGTGAVITVEPQVETTYVLEGTDIYGCEVQQTVTLSPTFFDYNVSGDQVICEGETTVLSVTNNTPEVLNYLWTPPDGIIGANNQSSVVVMPNETTTYTVFITHAELGCLDTAEVLVEVGTFDPDDLEIFIDKDTIILGEGFVLSTNQSPENFYFWDGPGIVNPNLPVITAIPNSAGSYAYAVTVTNDEGCRLTGIISSLIVINPFCNMEEIFVPDAFSPNGDGQNDELFVYGNFITSLELRIFNRWGEEVFMTKDQGTGWDGTFKGKELTPDVYGYYLRVQCPPDKSYFTKGNITLFK
jgi:gliding motility-associated-like protein